MNPARLLSARRRARGFALIVTIVLVAFLVLILVGLATFTRVETQVATNSQTIAQARQNALMALNIAVGQLQKHTGPDQRVTATADLITPPGHSWESVDYDETASILSFPSANDYENARVSDAAEIDNAWRSGARNRQWVGAWKNGNTSSYDSNNPANYNPTPELQAWLVSGNEITPDAFKPTDVVAGLSSTSSPLDRLGTPDNPHRLLVKTTASAQVAADGEDPAPLERAVTAPEIPIKSTSVPGMLGEQTVGHYAWWVGDEGVKARVNQVDRHAVEPASESSAEEQFRLVTRFQSSQRFAIEAIHPDLEELDPAPFTNSDDLRAFHTKLGQIVAPTQLPYLAPAAADFSAKLKKSYHTLSIWSRGVLSDARHGGLKADLTYLFGRSSLSDFRTALDATFPANDLVPNRAANDWNNLLGLDAGNNGTGTIYATLPTDTPVGGGSYATSNIFRNSATWEQLWSFANQGSTINGSGEATPRHHTATQHGLYPLVIQSKLFFRLRIVGGALDEDGVNRSGTIYVDTIPVVLLANPYAVPLAPADYHLRFTNPSPVPRGMVQLVYGATDDTSSPTTDFAARAFPPAADGSTTDPSYMGNVTFVLPTNGMAAGEAQIFTIDPAANAMDSEDRFEITHSNDTRQVFMKNDFDPVPALTFNTGQSIPATIPNPAGADPATIPATRVALRIGNGGLVSQLYLNYTSTNHQLRLLQLVNNQGTTEGAGFSGGQSHVLVVDPMSNGTRQGGGVIAVINQPPTTDNPAARKPNIAGVLFSQQQAPFAQVNYRTLRVTYTGESSHPHPLEWARRFIKNGSTGSPGDSPNPWLAANLLRPSGSTTTARWGIVNVGEGADQTTPPASIGGNSAGDVGFRNFLYDIPRRERPLSSLGQLQHFNTAGFIDTTANNDIHTWQVNYALSNSYPQPRVPRDQVFFKYHKAAAPDRRSTGWHYDGSYLWNDLLWDRFTFSTFPQDPSVNFDFTSDNLINARLRPFRDGTNASEEFRGDNSTTSLNSGATARLPAKNLLVEGAFNVNSTSVDAWKSLFASLRNVPVGGESSPNAPFARTLTPSGAADDAETGTSPNSWIGLRDLDDTQLDRLAREMVMQVRKRGPFLSMAEFVNRRLSSPGSDDLELGLAGALQAALDRTINHREYLASHFQVTSSTRVDNDQHTTIHEPSYILPSALAGFPGYLLQGDLLSALGPALSVRSDTFTIRTYGDSVNPATGEVTGRAWCEAVVQRLPDYVRPETVAGGNLATDITGLHADNQTFGRRYQIVSFRWLNREDI